MIDIVVKALTANLTLEFKDYFDIETVYNSGLDVETEYQRTQELKPEKSMKFLNENTDGRVILAYNRTPITVGFGRGVPYRAWEVSKADHKKAQIKEALLCGFTVNFKLISNMREALEIFEIVYLLKKKLRTNLSISIEIADVEKLLNLEYNVDGTDISTFDLVNFQKYGSLWSLEFSMTVSGVVLSPESSYYPRLLNPKLNIFATNMDKKVYSLAANYILTIDEKYVLDSSGNVVRNDQSIVKDSVLISSRFIDENQ